MQNQLLAPCKEDIKISCIGHKQYLVDASINEAKFICETDNFDISSVLFDDDYQISVGNDFGGYGIIKHISVLRDNPRLSLLLRVVLI